MPRQPPLEEALASLRDELQSGQCSIIGLTTWEAWPAFLSFGRRRFDTPPIPEADGLLLQYGTYSFDGPPMFTLGLTRQFAVSDDGGEHDHHVQVQCELLYAPDSVLRALGTFNSWFFHDTGDDLGQWAEMLSDRLEPLHRRKPVEINLYEELV
ncbi:hypothetical protein GCM10020367_68230 [Streptomyces sannanensis]|uniref:Uncharacterized protein n=1 Tax=Streptomyces sannanensis TaxID=285536 RepID=A0ABP6S3B6_9ACTN